MKMVVNLHSFYSIYELTHYSLTQLKLNNNYS